VDRTEYDDNAGETTPADVDETAFADLVQVMNAEIQYRAPEDEVEFVPNVPLEGLLAARAYFNLALAVLADPKRKEEIPERLDRRKIFILPSSDGTICFVIVYRHRTPVNPGLGKSISTK
jgi:hypothetical protein